MFSWALHHLRAIRVSAVFQPLAVSISGVCWVAKPKQFAFAESLQRPSRRSPRRIIIDTDPGVDDALALLLALGSPDKLKVEGLTIVFGNGNDIRVLGANANLMLRLAGVESVPVSLGASPNASDGFVGATISLEGEEPVLVHGADNIGNVSEKYGRSKEDFTCFHRLQAPDFIYDACSKAPGEITLVCIGPLRNIATALKLHPDLPQLVDEVVIMGGAFGERWGNREPAAEANFFDDPEAAQTVLRANFRKVIVAGLNITHQTDMIVLRKACSASRATLSNFIWDVCEHYIGVYNRWGEGIAPAHDTVPVMYLLRPDLFEGRDVHVEVETRGEFTRGMSIADWASQWGLPPNCQLLMTIVDKEAYTQEYVRVISRLPLK